jgi:outer membrane protein
MISRRVIAAAGAACFLASAQSAEAEGLFSGDWYLTVGAAGFTAPAFEGSRRYILSGVPIISLGKKGKEAPFVSRNDNISFAFVDTGTFSVGAVGKLVMPRDASDHPELTGLSDIPFGVEIGAFAEVYPVEWLRLRGEVRRGIRAHEGFVGNVQVDAFADITEKVRVSAGPRLSFADAAYMDAYYGVSAAEAAASGLTAYDPGGGIKSLGVGGAVDWRMTDQVTTSVFGEYSRLMGPAANSSIVTQRGSKNQFMLGLSATYRFDFKL